MSIEPTPPKYAIIVNAMQDRITAGTYAIGAMLPSEADLVWEFGASRSTVVRALEFVRQQGWLEGQPGKGRIVLGRPAPRHSTTPARVMRLLDGEDTASVALLRATAVPATDRIAAVLTLSTPAKLVARRRLHADTGSAPPAFAVVYLPAEVARRVGLDVNAPVREGLLPRLDRAGLTPRHIAEQLSTRPPTAREASLLAVDRETCVFATTLTVLDAAGSPLLAVDAVQPADRTHVEHRYRLL
jgi:GntR family transcriptional regulator